jgi:hypothetical protein
MQTYIITTKSGSFAFEAHSSDHTKEIRDYMTKQGYKSTDYSIEIAPSYQDDETYSIWG